MYPSYYGQDDDDEDNCGAENSNLKDRQDSGLQEICLLAVLENLDRYCAAFKMRNSTVPRKHFEFLARRFTERIFQELKSTSRLKSEHFELLINPYMKNLDIVGIDKSLLPDLIEKLKRNGNDVLTFHASWTEMSKSICMPMMSALPKVENIFYQYEEYYDDLETKSLKEKIFPFGKIWSPQIPPICKAIGKNCRSLKSLTFDCYDIGYSKKCNDGIAFILKQCPRLETLHYCDAIGALYTLHKNDFPPLKNHKKSPHKTSVTYVLKTLSSGNRWHSLRDALKICTTVCPYVCHLQIDYLNNDEELQLISRFSHLEVIKFETMGIISSSALGNFLNLRGSKITSLEMPYKSGLSIETLIESCPKLQSLRLSYVQLPELNTVVERSCSVSLLDLRTVELSFTDFVIPEISAALKLILLAGKHIDSLSLISSSGLTNKLFSSLRLRRIRELDVSCSDITVDSLTELLLHGSLKRLRIEYCEKLSDEDYFALTRCEFENNKNVDIEYRPVRSPWRNQISCCMAYIP